MPALKEYKSGNGRGYGSVAGARPVSQMDPGDGERDYPLWDELTDRMKDRFARFVKILEKEGAIERSRRRVRLGSKSLRAMRRNPQIEARVLDAITLYRESCEKKIDKRAFDGVKEPVYFEGEVVGHKMKYSDALAMFRLRGLAPEIYAERHEHRHSGQVDHNIKVYIPHNQRDPHLANTVPGPDPAKLIEHEDN